MVIVEYLGNAKKHYKDGDDKDYEEKLTDSSLNNFMRDPGRDDLWENNKSSTDNYQHNYNALIKEPISSTLQIQELKRAPYIVKQNDKEELKKNYIMQFASPYHKLELINKLEDNKINSLKRISLENLNRSKRSITNLPSDAHKIIIHNVRNFDVYGSSNGAYIVIHGSNNARKIPGVDGKVIHGIITDAYYQQKYNIYLTVKNDNCIYQYYALKDGETTAHKINGLPDNAKLLSIHNLASVIFFGSSNGAYELIQGQLNASKISHINGNVVKIKLNGSSRKYDADFITLEDTFSKCTYLLELKKLEKQLNNSQIEIARKHTQINILKQLFINQQNKFELDEDQIKLKELQKTIIKYNSLDPDQFLLNIENIIKNIQNKTNNKLDININVRSS